jgi:aminoglycoside phosphotransferase (APT) family kinase protein
VEQWLAKEIALLPELAPVLPVGLPRLAFVARNGVRCVGYRKIEGTPVDEHVDGPHAFALAHDLGAFLAALHRFPVDRARALGVPSHDRPSWRERFQGFWAHLRLHVCPLLAASQRKQAVTMFERFLEDDGNFSFDAVVLHSDLGPEHILCRGGRVAGIIDWSDARIADPALDLAWLLWGTPAAFGQAVLERYGGPDDPTLAPRAGFYHRLSPWHEVAFGLEVDRADHVRRGLDGIRSRLPRPLPYER